MDTLQQNNLVYLFTKVGVAAVVGVVVVVFGGGVSGGNSPDGSFFSEVTSTANAQSDSQAKQWDSVNSLDDNASIIDGNFTAIAAARAGAGYEPILDKTIHSLVYVVTDTGRAKRLDIDPDLAYLGSASNLTDIAAAYDGDSFLTPSEELGPVIYAVTDTGQAKQWDGSRWVDFGSASNLTDITADYNGSGKPVVYAVTDTGQAKRWDNADGWEDFTSANNLTDIDVVYNEGPFFFDKSGPLVYAITDTGQAKEWNNTDGWENLGSASNFTDITAGYEKSLVGGSGPGQGTFALTETGQVKQWDGSRWLDIPSADNLTEIDAVVNPGSFLESYEDSGLYAIAETSNNPPTASFTTTPKSPETGQQVSFDATGSSDPEDSFSDLEFAWDFGNGSTTSFDTGYPMINHTYNSAGTYTTELTVKDTGGATSSTSTDVTVPSGGSGGEATTTGSIKVEIVDQNGTVIAQDADVAPTVDGITQFPKNDASTSSLNWSVTVGETPKTAELTQSSINLPAGYDFVDSNWITKSTENNYNDNPVNDGSSKATTSKLGITPGSVNQSPTAVISAPSSTNTGDQVTFDASNSSDPEGGIDSYSWDDASDSDGRYDNGSGSSINRTYSSTGNKTVSVQVADGDGATDSTSTMVSISSSGSGICNTSTCSWQSVNNSCGGSGVSGTDCNSDESVEQYDCSDTDCSDGQYRCVSDSNCDNSGEPTNRESIEAVDDPSPGQSYEIMKNETRSVSFRKGLLDNDKDAEGDRRHDASLYDTDIRVDTVTIGSIPQHGNFSVQNNGSFTYTPNNGYVGQEDFSYRLTNGYDSDSARVEIAVKEYCENDSQCSPGRYCYEDKDGDRYKADIYSNRTCHPDDDLGEDCNDDNGSIHEKCPELNSFSASQVCSHDVSFNRYAGAVKGSMSASNYTRVEIEKGPGFNTSWSARQYINTYSESESSLVESGSVESDPFKVASLDDSSDETELRARACNTNANPTVCTDWAEKSIRNLSSVSQQYNQGICEGVYAADDKPTYETDHLGPGGHDIDVLGNDGASDGSVTIESVGQPSNGDAEIETTFGRVDIEYTPNRGFYGTDTFTYTISDPNGDTDSATVEVEVKECNETRC